MRGTCRAVLGRNYTPNEAKELAIVYPVSEIMIMKPSLCIFFHSSSHMYIYEYICMATKCTSIMHFIGIHTPKSQKCISTGRDVGRAM